MALDVIEHLAKEDGLRLMRAMEKISRRKVIFFTPSGFLPQCHLEKNDLQEHLSGWEVAEMKQHGYQVIGMLGPKALRGEFHNLKWRPKFFLGWREHAWTLSLDAMGSPKSSRHTLYQDKG